MRRYGLAALVALFVLLGFGYSVVIPLGEAPDEVPHWSYIQYLVEQHGLPPSEGPVVGESHQPPLYYLLLALATAEIPRTGFQVIANPGFTLDDPETPNFLMHSNEAFPYQGDVLAWHLARMVSVVMGAITVAATWQLGRQIFPEDPWTLFGAAAFIAFLPGFVSISAVVNNDNLLVMFSSIGLWQMFRMTQRMNQWRDTALLGILLGLAALTKLSGLILWVFAAGLFLLIAFKTKEWKKCGIHSTLCFTIAVAIIVPWMVYNWLNFGDPLAWSLYLSVVSLRPGAPTFAEWVGITQGLYKSFWGSYGGALQLRMSDVVYAALGSVGILSLAGWICNLLDARKRLPIPPTARAVLVLFVSFWALLLAAYARWSIMDLAAGEARLLFPGLPPLAIFLATGLKGLFVSRLSIAMAIMAGALLVLNLAVLFYLHSIFALT
jgi:4-amino-4-deoxy-L-arabinose transferase-like glycosyltransferase